MQNQHTTLMNRDTNNIIQIQIYVLLSSWTLILQSLVSPSPLQDSDQNGYLKDKPSL